MNTNNPDISLLSYKESGAKIGVCRTKFNELLVDESEDFPRPLIIGRRRFILKPELEAWVLGRPRVELRINTVKKLLNAVEALPPGQLVREIKIFRKVYPAVVRKMARQVPEREILSALKSAGLILTQAQFRAMLEAERRLHNQYGECICCDSCGTVLQPNRALEFQSELDEEVFSAMSAKTNEVTEQT